MRVENDQTLGVGYVVCRWCFILYAPCSVCNRVQRHFKLFNRSVEVCKHVQPRECLFFFVFRGASWKDNKRRRNKRLGSHSCSSYKPHKGYKDRKHHKDSPQWRWLRDITPRFMYRRSVGVWMKKNAQYDLHGHRSHPWTTKALTAQNWAEWKLLRIGLSTRPGIAMTLSETALHALFRVWESYGLGTAVAPQWTGPGCAGRSGGHGKGHGPQFFFKNVESVPHNWYDASDATNYNASPPSMVEVGGTISSGGRSKKSTMEEAPAAVAPPTTLPNAATSTSSMMRGVEQVCATSVQPVFNRVQPGS